MGKPAWCHQNADQNTLAVKQTLKQVVIPLNYDRSKFDRIVINFLDLAR